MRPGEPVQAPEPEGFDLSVLAAGEHVWVSAQSSQGAVFAVPQPPPDWSLPAGFTEPADWLNTVIRTAATDATAQAARIGRTLTGLVFGVAEIAELFALTRGVARENGSRLLVRLKVAPERVGAWPWELLLDPHAAGGAAEPEFLTGARQTHIVRTGRFRRYADRRATEPVQTPLNVLVVLSSPLPDGAGLDVPFDLYAEKRSLLDGLRPLCERGLLRVVVEDRPTLARLRERVCHQPGGFQVLHYLGHAAPDGFRLEDATGRGRFVPTADVCDMLAELPDLRLAVFAGCETARAPTGGGDWRDTLSTADLFVRDVCPMVIGMQTVLPFATERVFTRSFYRALTGGQTVAGALRFARLAITADEQTGAGRLNWAVPTLHLGGMDAGPLIDPQRRSRPVPIEPPVRERLGIYQSERRFIARLPELREAVDVLSGSDDRRLLHVAGPAGAGKTAFLDRVLDELPADTIGVLVGAARLLADAARLRRDRDPLGTLVEFVARAVQLGGHRRVRIPLLKEPRVGWQRLLTVMDSTPIALVVDEADLLIADELGRRVLDALTEMLDRRLTARLALASTGPLPGLTDDPRQARYVGRIRLDLLSWPEVRTWIRRNLPELNGFDEEELLPCYHRLTSLEQWEDLATAIREDRSVDRRPAELADRIVTAAPPAPPADVYSAAGSARPTALSVEIPRRLLGAGDDFAGLATELAAAHGVAGRVVAAEPAPSGPALATVVTTDGDAPAVLLSCGSQRLTIAAEAPVAGIGLVVGTDLTAGPDPAGPDCAVLRVAAAALLVWAGDRTLTAAQVRKTLLATATDDAAGCARLDLDAALTARRRTALVAALEAAPLRVGQLLAATPVRPDLAVGLLDELVADGSVRRAVSGGVERYELGQTG